MLPPLGGRWREAPDGGYMNSKEDLRRLLLSIDHRGYPAYKDTRGPWRFDQYTLSIDHVQGDPFASPSHVSVIVPGQTAAFPEEYRRTPHRRIALEDHLLRLFYGAVNRGRRREESRPQKSGVRSSGGAGHRAGSGKSGLITTSRPVQEILERTACRVQENTGTVTLRFEMGFPANGRSINAREMIHMLYDVLPGIVSSSLIYRNIDTSRLKKTVDLADDQHAVRECLPALGLCAFVADGSILPRASGVTQTPMKDAVPFRSPDSLAVELDLPHRGKVRGMGIRRGVTLIVGGGYHGKSTLLQALERGVYDHIPGDGRELVVTDHTAMKIRAEDGRSVREKDISLFIRNLPNGKNTDCFSTEDASGSTSQAANVAEAMEAGSRLLLIDEDTSATNFMVRDELMAGIVLKEQEPITPFLSRIRDLYEISGISTILVAGSSGAYFHVSDAILQMDHYIPADITEKVREELGRLESIKKEPAQNAEALTGTVQSRFYRAEDYHFPNTSRPVRPNQALRRESRLKLKTLSEDNFLIAHDEVDVRGLEQIADREQTQTLAYILKYMQLHILDGKKTLQQAVDEMQKLLDQKGLEVLFDGSYAGNGLCRVRPEEIYGMINRYRK